MGPVPSRAQARQDTTEQIKAIALERLAADGPNLSLRAVARELGVVSSAVYRYFASRDDLLTALIIDGYAAMGEAAEVAEEAVSRRDLLGRWFALGHALRDWSLAQPHVFALLYGSPVPDYQAPRDTVPQAQRALVLAMRILADGYASRDLVAPRDRLPKPVRADVEVVGAMPGFDGVPPTLLARAMSVWAQLFGTLGFELFGRYTNAVTDYDAYFDYQLKVMARHLGLA